MAPLISRSNSSKVILDSLQMTSTILKWSIAQQMLRCSSIGISLIECSIRLTQFSPCPRHIVPPPEIGIGSGHAASLDQGLAPPPGRRGGEYMNVWELVAIAVGLSMDAFAVSVCKGLSVGRVRPRHALTAGIYFGGFQMLMPLMGYLLGVRFQDLIAGVDHWIAFVLLGLIGGNMIRESRGDDEALNASFGPRAMLPLAVATSIDALAVGVTFAFLRVDILPAIGAIGAVTLVLAGAGVYVGGVFGSRFQAKAQLTGGVILLLLGLDILAEHLGWMGLG